MINPSTVGERKLLVVNADDFGLSTGTNLGIKKAHQNGILTSASLFATTPGFEDAIKIAKECPNLGIGIHLSLTEGKPVVNPEKVSKLVDKDGDFHPSYGRLIFKSLTDKNFLSQVKNELETQVKKIFDAGINIDHINSQQHVHMIPNIYPLVVEIAKKAGIKYIRIPREDFWLTYSIPELVSPFIDINIIKFLLMRFFALGKKPKKTVRFFGVIYTTKTNKLVLKNTLSRLKPGITEILVHPAYFQITRKEKALMNYKKQKMINFMKDRGRQTELSALTDVSIRNFIKNNNITLINYRNLSDIQ